MTLSLLVVGLVVAMGVFLVALLALLGELDQ